MTIDLQKQTSRLLNYLGHKEQPFAILYSNEKPANTTAPLPGPPVSRELEEKGLLDRAAMEKTHSCFLAHINLARRQNKCAYVSKEQYGCLGGGFYTGYLLPYLQGTTYFVSTGTPSMPGERYMSSPQAVSAYMDKLNPRPAPASYCLAMPLSMLESGEKAELIVFFARPEVISGLFTLAVFTTSDPLAVVSPFGAGCAQIITWPYYFKERGQEKAVLGGFDPSCRPFFKTDELSFTISLELYEKMLGAMDESFFINHDWPAVLRKVGKSNAAWDKPVIVF